MPALPAAMLSPTHGGLLRGRASKTCARSREDWKKKLQGRIGHGDNGCMNVELSIIEDLQRWLYVEGCLESRGKAV